MSTPAPSVPGREAGQGAAPERSSTAVLTAALAEFNKLRDEIASRSSTLWTLLGLSATISTAVAGFVLSNKADPLLLLLLPLVTPALGLLVIDHATNIGNIGQYINSQIAPLVREVAGEDRLFGYEAWVDRWETRRLRRTIAFGVPLVLLFSIVPVFAVVYTVTKLETVWLWGLWVIGLLMTAFQVAMWVAFLAPPLLRSSASTTADAAG